MAHPPRAALAAPAVVAGAAVYPSAAQRQPALVVGGSEAGQAGGGDLWPSCRQAGHQLAHAGHAEPGCGSDGAAEAGEGEPVFQSDAVYR
ncbi:hypothetical protein D3C80_1584160 [compost metagenome]